MTLNSLPSLPTLMSSPNYWCVGHLVFGETLTLQFRTMSVRHWYLHTGFIAGRFGRGTLQVRHRNKHSSLWQITHPLLLCGGFRPLFLPRRHRRRSFGVSPGLDTTSLGYVFWGCDLCSTGTRLERRDDLVSIPRLWCMSRAIW